MIRRYASCRFALFLACLFLFVPASEAWAQEAEQKALREAFAAGDARAVLQHGARRVEVSLLGSRSQYSRSQAVYVLQKFFDEHPPRRFAWEDTTANGQNRFMTGRYWHGAFRKPLPVYVRLSKTGEGWTLQEVRIGRS